MQNTRSMSEPLSLTACTIGALGTSPCAASSWNAGVSSTLRRMMIAGDDDDHAEQERDPPAPRLEGLRRHRRGQRQEHRGGEDLAGLHALQREAAEVAAPAERRVFDDHRARAGDLTADGEALDQPQHHQQRRRPAARPVVGRQERRPATSSTPISNMQSTSMFLRPCVSPEVPQHERPDGPGHVADTERRERRDDGDLRIALREEDVREDQRGGLGVDEEVVVLERAADPAAGRGLLRLLRDTRWARASPPARRSRPACVLPDGAAVAGESACALGAADRRSGRQAGKAAQPGFPLAGNAPARATPGDVARGCRGRRT